MSPRFVLIFESQSNDLPKKHRIDDELVINQAVLREFVGDGGAAENDHVAAGLLLHPFNLARNDFVQ